jgi:hypothetical protein
MLIFWAILFVFFYFLKLICCDISCDILTGYYNGTFKNSKKKTTELVAEFEVKLYANASYNIINGWFINVSAITNPNIEMHLYDPINPVFDNNTACKLEGRCSAPYPKRYGTFEVHVHDGTSQSKFNVKF